jgi:hypothetical protein
MKESIEMAKNDGEERKRMLKKCEKSLMRVLLTNKVIPMPVKYEHFCPVLFH